MIGAPVPGVVNALQVTIPGRSPSVPSVKALGNARDEKNIKHYISKSFLPRFLNDAFFKFPLLRQCLLVGRRSLLLPRQALK